MRPTPRNSVLGLFSDIVNLPLQYMSSPERTQQMQGTAQFLYGTGIPKTLERMSYGDSLFSGAGMTLRPKEETINAAMNVAPFAPAVGRLASRAVRATEGLPIGMSIKDVSYRGSHTAPSSEFGAPLYDLTGGGQMYPADVYSAKAAQYYGTGNKKADIEAFNLAKRVRGNPDAEVTMYRAVPKNADISAINAGDWVTLSKDYAKTHGESVLGNDYKILSQKVKAKELWTNADSIHEFGYQPQQFQAPQQAALDLAQQRAALPVEQGGLGLSANNTPMDRAKAMGFETDLLHGTAKDFPAFDLSKAGTNTRQAGDELGIFSTSKPFLADDYAQIASKGGWANRTSPDNPVVYPLVGNFSNPKKYQTASQFYRDADAMAAEQNLGNWRKQLQGQGYDSVFVRPDLEEVVAFSPDQLRSRFAAFDPFRKDVATATAMGVALPDLLAQPVNQYQPTYETIPMYTDPFGNTIGSSIR